MTKEVQNIRCPNCGHEFAINDLIFHQIQEQVENETELILSEKDRMIKDLSSQMQNMQRKITQGSMQVQGETLELEIEDYLKSTFKLDTIKEVPKGVKGADCIQIINTPSKFDCGSILYEAKRTKEFSKNFISKLKEDLREKGATFAVLVTQSLPKGIDRLGQIDGIWVCNFENFKSVCFVLREAVIQLNNAISIQEGKEDKVHLLYDYLVSAEFRMQIEAIVEGFCQLETDLASERRAMEAAWKKREKRIQMVLKNTIHFYSSIKAIAGNSIGNIKALELSAPEEQIQNK